MTKIEDAEFGTITIRRSAQATSIRLRVAPDGRLRASMPVYAPIFLLKRLLKSSREELRAMLQDSTHIESYVPGQQIGKSHTLIARPTARSKPEVHRHGQQIIVDYPESHDFQHESIQRTVRDGVITALRVEAKSYLPKRLAFLATKYRFSYQKVRFSHAGSRWGSCSSSGTISLNIALMKLPFELIDYVLIHELSHTEQMNHSSEFWDLVAQADPAYKLHRKALKQQAPTI